MIAASGNGRLLSAYEHCHIPLFQIRVGQSREYIEDYELAEREHREIIAALKTGKIDVAVEALRAHLARGATDVLSFLTEHVPAS